MNLQESASATRADLISQSLKRHRLVFVQIGSLFEPLRDSILDALGGVRASIADRGRWLELTNEQSVIVIDDLDSCVNSDINVLGEVRELVISLLDQERKVCLVSRAPRISYRSVPGSSVLEDAALANLPTLSAHEAAPGDEPAAGAGWPLPAVTFGSPLTGDTFAPALAELGSEIVAALDHALFEVDPKSLDGLQFLSPREVEGLRGAGLVWIDEHSNLRLTQYVSSKVLKEALSEHISRTVVPSDQLPVITSGLWHIERAIRRALRAAAISKYSSAWRAGTVGGLKDEILRRAQLEGSVAANSIDDVRDPLEWLTLSELLDVVRSEKFDNLGIESAIWRRLQEQLVPIRNRLAHVRMLKSNDHEIVRMWLSVVRDRLK